MKKFLLIVGLSLVMVACQMSQIVQLVNAAVLIAEQAAAITGAVPPQYVAYVQAASTCITFITTEQVSTDTPVVRYDKDAAACAKAVSVSLPPGTAQNVLDMASKLATSIQDILAGLKPAPVGTTARTAQEKPPSSNDIKALKVLGGRAKAAGQQVAKK